MLTAFYGQESAIAPLTEEVSHGVSAPLPHGVGRQMPGMKHLQMVASGGLLSWLETCPLRVATSALISFYGPSLGLPGLKSSQGQQELDC